MTKYIKAHSQLQHKPVEYPGLAIFLPNVQNSEKARLTSGALERIEDPSEIMLVVNDKFL